jgi:hypothetical protein
MGKVIHITYSNVIFTNEFSKFSLPVHLEKSVNLKKLAFMFRCISYSKSFIGPPIKVDENNTIVDGIARFIACKELNVPFLFIYVD